MLYGIRKCSLTVNDRFDTHMEYRSSTIKSQSWYFTNFDDSRINVTPNPPSVSSSVNSVVSIDPNNPNRIITGGGQVMDNGDIRTLFEIETNTPYSETKVA